MVLLLYEKQTKYLLTELLETASKKMGNMPDIFHHRAPLYVGMGFYKKFYLCDENKHLNYLFGIRRSIPNQRIVLFNIKMSNKVK